MVIAYAPLVAFQSSPLIAEGRNRASWWRWMSSSRFQSSPLIAEGRNPRQRNTEHVAVEVSILAPHR